MNTIVGILLIALVLGLLFRSKGDGLLDTLSSGCGCLVAIAIGLVVLFFLAYS
jgi:hypothetical protein